jgi:mono/diheme cytochrome c family protein
VLRSVKSIAAGTVVVLASIAPAFAEGDTSAEAGKVLYEDVGCASCHGYEGEGPLAPRLKGSNAIKDIPTFASRILYGGGDMAPFDYLADAEIAAIANYVRTVINKQTVLMTEEDVAARR